MIILILETRQLKASSYVHKRYTPAPQRRVGRHEGCRDRRIKLRPSIAHSSHTATFCTTSA